MAHEVETMFSARVTPWHKLGVITDRNLTAREALVTAGLDWKVEKQPIYAMTGHGFQLIDDRVATVRSSDQSVLGVVGSQYEPIQNERMLTWAELLVDTGQAQFTTAGSLRDGRVVFACLEIDREIKLPGGDQVVPYFVVASSHDGSAALRGFTSGTRVVCANTLHAAEMSKKSSWTVRHTQSADWRLDAARQMLGMVVGYYDEFNELAHRMIDQTVTDLEFKQLTRQLFPMPKPKDGMEVTHRMRDYVFHKRNSLNAIYRGDTIGEFRGTGWGVFNAVNEWELWEQRIKGDRHERQAIRAMTRDFPLTEKTEKFLVGLS